MSTIQEDFSFLKTAFYGPLSFKFEQSSKCQFIFTVFKWYISIVLLAHFPFNGTVANLIYFRVSFCIIVLLTCYALECGFQLSIKFLN